MTANSRPDRLLLISDLHLEEDRPELTQAFYDFLDREASNSSALYILGDFLNLWIGDDDDRPLNQALSKTLRSHADQGLDIFLMHGNRDFLLGEAFAERSGAQLLPDAHILQAWQHSCLLLHGDQLCTRDESYQAFREQVRNPLWQQAFLSKPLAERRAFADQARATSQSMNSNKAEDIMDVSQDAVEKIMIEHEQHCLIHGHTHRPADHRFELESEPAIDGPQQEFRRLVLGDWGSSGWFIDITPAAIVLHEFPVQD